MTTPVPAPLQAFIDATNRGDSEAFTSVFAEDAVLDDWGRTFHGRDGVASWNRTDQQSGDGNTAQVRGRVAGTPVAKRQGKPCRT